MTRADRIANVAFWLAVCILIWKAFIPFLVAIIGGGR